MSRSKKWPLLWILIPITVMGMIGLLLIHYFLDPKIYRNALQESLTTALGREVTIGKAKISLRGGIGIACEDLRIKDRSLAFDLLHSKKLIVRAKLFPLMKREVKWKRIILEQPTLRIFRDKNRRFNIFDPPASTESWKASQQKIIQTLSSLFGGSLTLLKGEIYFSDESLGDSPLNIEIRSFNLTLPKVSYRAPFPFQIDGKISHSRKEGSFSIAGKIQNIPENLDFSKGKMDAEVEMKEIEIFHFWPYLKTLLPMKTISGALHLKAHYQGDFSGSFKTAVKIKLKNVTYDHPQVFAQVLTLKWMNIDLDVDYDLKDIRVPRISVELPEVRVKAKGRIYAIGSKEMGIEAEAQSGLFDLSEGKKFIPFRIITPDVSDPLSRSEGSGPVQILSVKLSGKIPEIEHCDQPQYAHVLSVEMKAEKARLKLPWNLPWLEDLKGQLLFKEGYLNLKEVGGRIFHSSIDRANGIFYQFLQVPTLQIHFEGQMDLKDLPSFAKIKELSADFSNMISPMTLLSGSADYQLSVKGVLKPPLRFQHQGSYLISKARFTHQQLPFPVSIGEGKIELSNNQFQWSGMIVEFGNSSLLMNGSVKMREKVEPLEITAKGRVDLKNLFHLSQSTLFPEEIRLKTKEIESLSGTGQLSFEARGMADRPHTSYDGELIPEEISLLLKGVTTPITFKDGTFSFSNLGVGFSKMRIQSDSGSLTLDGDVKENHLNLWTKGSIHLKNLHSLLHSSLVPEQMRSQMDGIQELTGEAEVRLRIVGRTENWMAALKEGEIRLKGVSFQHRKIPVPLSHVEGSLLFSPEQIRSEKLKGKLGESPLTLTGSLSRASTSPSAVQFTKAEAALRRSFSFQIFSPQLDLNPLFPKREEPTPTSFMKLRDWLLRWDMNGKIEAERGRYRDLHFQDLKVEMRTVDNKLFFDSFQFKADGGDLWGKGWIEPTDKGIRFGINPRLSSMDAKALFPIFSNKGEDGGYVLTGRAHLLNVELQGEGEDFQKIKESLHGKFKLEVENGVIERFNILAKIFSILNVSQWFQGRLPDLRTKGLPYHRIVANFNAQKGVFSTEDFLIDSDAMRITAMGKVDVGKNQIDAKVGIHPLITVDKFLSSVPIAGYILTGKDKAFLSYLYEVKGDRDNPKIEAIPIKSMEESFFGIIKRLLETPVRPFQKSPSSE